MNNPRVGDNQRSNPSPGRIRASWRFAGESGAFLATPSALSGRYLVSSKPFFPGLFSKKRNGSPGTTRENAITTHCTRCLNVGCTYRAKWIRQKLCFVRNRRIYSARTASPHETRRIQHDSQEVRLPEKMHSYHVRSVVVSIPVPFLTFLYPFSTEAFSSLFPFFLFLFSS